MIRDSWKDKGEKVPNVGTLADLIYEEMSKGKRLFPPGFETQGRKTLQDLVDTLLSAGWRFIPPGSHATLYVQQPVEKIEPASFFCPHCGAHKPAYGVSPQVADVPGFGKLEYVTIFYGCCRTAMQMIVTGSTPGQQAVQ